MFCLDRKYLVAALVAVFAIGCGKSEFDRNSSEPDDQRWELDGGVADDADDGDADAVECEDGSSPSPEECNEEDDDCDGIVDEGCPCNYGDVTTGVCSNAVYSPDDGNCATPNFYEEEESLCDGRDNDCDGAVDEGCSCEEGETKSCYSGPSDTEDVGACQAGTLECTDNTFGDSCDGEVIPRDEECNDVDDDCDGVVDESCTCSYDGDDTGVCSEGTLDEFGNCGVPDDYQNPENACDDLDNDCDGVVDENCSCGYTGTSHGVCSGGVISEDDGSCVEPDNYEAEETSCDGRDNDCDGLTDEGCECDGDETRSCYDGPEGTEGVGICQSGEQTCVDGEFGTNCENQITPQAESCNGHDDDCDGVTDEGCSCDYSETSEGVCSDGSIDSTGSCTAPENREEDETTCDGRDNDCDGVTDEGCPCNYQDTTTGVCSDGSIGDDGTCSAPSDYETDETSCDELDNDCDDTVDEGCSCNYQETTTGVCSDGTTGDDGSCSAPSDYESDETSCDELDNDCDGVTDEFCPCDYDGTDVGVCGDATRNEDGNCTPPDGYTGAEAHCDDGLDNDCDGQIDCDDPDCAQRPECR